MNETEVFVNGRPFKGKNLIGLRFGSLVVVSLDHLKPHAKSKPSVMWLCRCECGNPKCKGTRVANGGLLKNGTVDSCGCVRRMPVVPNNLKHGFNRKGVPHPFYDTWRAVLKRCQNPKAAGYHNYGGRGIAICERWRTSFVNFHADLFSSWKPGLWIERINVNGNYEPGNVRWATPTEQGRNRRNNRTITAFGKTMCLIEWSELCGLGPVTISTRIDRGGVSAEIALTSPSTHINRKSTYKHGWLEKFLAQTP